MATPEELRSAVLDVNVEKVQSILLQQPDWVRTVYTPTHTLLHDVTGRADDYYRRCGYVWPLRLAYRAAARSGRSAAIVVAMPQRKELPRAGPADQTCHLRGLGGLATASGGRPSIRR